MKKTELGSWGEQRAAELLEKKGYRVIGRNFRCRFGEIDLIARKDHYLVFAEVKLRKNAAYGEAKEFVNYSKQQKIRLAAEYYLSARPWTQELQPRFDVLEVYAPQGADGSFSLTHLEDAFE